MWNPIKEGPTFFLSVSGLSLFVNHCEDPRQKGEQLLAVWPNTFPLQIVSTTISLMLGIQRLRLNFTKRTSRTSTFFLKVLRKKIRGACNQERRSEQRDDNQHRLLSQVLSIVSSHSFTKTSTTSSLKDSVSFFSSPASTRSQITNDQALEDQLREPAKKSIWYRENKFAII